MLLFTNCTWGWESIRHCSAVQSWGSFSPGHGWALIISPLCSWPQQKDLASLEPQVLLESLVVARASFIHFPLSWHLLPLFLTCLSIFFLFCKNSLTCFSFILVPFLSYSFIYSDPSSLASSEELSWRAAAAIFSNEPSPCQRWGNLPQLHEYGSYCS